MREVSFKVQGIVWGVGGEVDKIGIDCVNGKIVRIWYLTVH